MTTEIKLLFKRLNPNAQLPSYAHTGDSGMDICAIEDVEIQPHSFAKIHTGLAVILPDGYELQVRPRSGMQCNKGIVGAWGTVDSQYRGEIGVALYNHTNSNYKVQCGDRIAQLVLAPVIHAQIKETYNLETNTERGTLGLGSSGR